MKTINMIRQNERLDMPILCDSFIQEQGHVIIKQVYTPYEKSQGLELIKTGEKNCDYCKSPNWCESTYCSECRTPFITIPEKYHVIVLFHGFQVFYI